ncbi:uncharacterized protein LOC106074474 isoform X2 [Biomphalaria glabrata]|uniref:Uncharacterized protein LOC106074474 isoform X2 n=1 Tax=Biomphalaria glabrata TaxID=6526 RepID=A0A9W2ZM45_BIOGL|nr:uncharacterized protein LOC106074474 isoform X2 [Biomphalaria glabrata]
MEQPKEQRTPSKKSGSKRSTKSRARPQRHKLSYKTRAATWLEPRILMITTGVTLLGVLFQVIAIATESWLIMNVHGEGVYRNSSGKFLLEAYTGLWRLCRVELEKKVDQAGKEVEIVHETCERHNLFPKGDDKNEGQPIDSHHLARKGISTFDYTRTAIAFTLMALFIMAIGHCFAFYALRRPRYIIKRLAALLHFMTAACLLVLNEVFIKTVDHEKKSMPDRIPLESVTRYGYSFILSWIVFVLFILAGLIFLFMSHKKKPEYTDGNEAIEDEPVEIFRR